MIGEVVKLGFDGTAVKRGLNATLGSFRKLGRGIGSATKEIGRGAALSAGHSLFGTILSGLKAIPNEIDNMSQLNKEIKMMGISTGITAKRYLALRSAISKATGMDSDEATDFVRDVSERLGEAMTDFESTPRKAMIAMGIRVSDIRGKNVDEQMKIIGDKFRAFQGQHGIEEGMFQINELLGEVGKKMIPLFLNYEAGMEAAEEKTKGLSSQLKELDGDLESIFDIKSAFSLKFSEAALGFLQGIKAGGLEAKSIADWISSLDVAGQMKGVSQVIASEMNAIKNDGLWDWFKSKLSQLGAWLKDLISTAITEGIKGAIPTGGSIMKLFTGGGASGASSAGALQTMKNKIMNKSDAKTAMIEQNTARTNDLLERLTDDGIVGRFA